MPGKLIHTLRFRLTLWNSLVVLIATLLALFAVREGMRLTIEHEARDVLRDEATELELAVTESFPDMNRIHEEFARKILGHSQHNWFAGLIDDDSQVVWKSENFPRQWFKDKTQRTAASPFEFDKTSEMLLVRHPVRANDQTRFIIILGKPTQFIKNDVWNLTKIMLMIGAVLLFVAPIGGYVLARRATQPVREIIKMTRSLNPSQLDNRLSIRGTGDELDQISIEINSFVDQISKYLRSHREFIANAAHELRSPLTAIQTSVEVSLGKDRSLVEYREELETVSEQCEHLRHLVNQLLELAETDAAVQNMTMEEFNLVAMVRKSIDVFEGVAEEKGVSINAYLPTHFVIKGNESKLRQVINNLLDNALKFSSESGQVDVDLVCDAEGLKLTIRDTGPGVPDDNLEKIFERFFQVDGSRQRTTRQGNGLGLSICKSIIELHGGKIHATNLERGLAVEVQLPNLNNKVIQS